MSDWTDTLDARRAGLVEGFYPAGGPVEEEPEPQAQAATPAAVEAALLERIAHLEARQADADAATEQAKPARKPAARKTTKKASAVNRKNV